MSFRYIGSKARLVKQISEHFGAPSGGCFVDAFCGTGAVAEIAALAGWRIKLNDTLHSALAMASARLAHESEVPFSHFGGYGQAASRLNCLSGKHGFIWRTYSPASASFCDTERRYFTEANAAKIDAIRLEIQEWLRAGKISAAESNLLIADLLNALNRVANIAGTFGCFLSKWTPQSQRSLTIIPRSLKSRFIEVECIVGDAQDINYGPADVVYLDPPYTKRQYASYYHILETVTLGDEPIVEGVSGLRPWKQNASEFCYKTRAKDALEQLLSTIPSHRILLSYSSEGHIPISDLKRILSDFSDARLYPIAKVGRYRPNTQARDNGSEVTEFLAVVEQSAGRLVTTVENAEVV